MSNSAPLPSDETQRLALLREFDILDSAQEDAFDDLAELAAFICGTPIAIISLIDEQRQWFKSAVGTSERQLPRSVSICAHAIARPAELLVVPDMRGDARFADHPYVVKDPHIRFYAGMPLDVGGGASAIGTLCVVDTVPRELTAEQRKALATLAKAVVTRIRTRRSLSRAEGFFAGFAEHSPSPLWIKRHDGAYIMGNAALHRFHGLPVAEQGLIGKNDGHFWPEEVAASRAEQDRQVLHSKEVVKSIETSDDGKRHWLVQRFPIDVNGESFLGGSAVEMTTEVEKERALVRHDNFYLLLSRMTGIISRARTLESLCLDTCRLASKFLGIEIVDISRLDEASDELRLFMSAEADGSARDWTGREEQVAAEAHWCQPELAAQAVRTGKMVFFNEPDDGGGPNRHTASYMAIPLLAHQKAWGVICFYSPRRHCFDSFYRERAAEIGNEICFGLERLINARELYELSHVNRLTGLPTRLHFEERIAALAAAGVAGTLVLINVNRIDEINSAYGNTASQGLIKQVAERLQAAVPEHMLLSYNGTGRLGLFIPGADGVNPAGFIGGVIAPLVQGAYNIDGHKIWCTINAGGAALPEDGNNADTLLVKAWEALAGARERGDSFGLYDRDADQLQARQLSLEAELRDAIEKREFVTYYQPKVDMKTGKLNGAEALIRWQHPTRGLVPPIEFVPVLERSGLIIEAGRQVLEQAMIDWRAWFDEGLMPPQIAVNVAPAQFKCDSLIRDIRRVLDIAEPHMQPLSIEITESSLVADPTRVVELLRAIRALEVPVAIDDFGTGYSSLAYLVTLPVDILKIDRSFVMKMTSDAGYMGLVSTIVSLAHNLDLKVVAEGIETEEEAKLLRLLRCEQGQGYLYSRPVPAQQFGELLRQR